jgi:hypothetical protein
VKRSNFWGRNNVSNKSCCIYFLQRSSWVGLVYSCANFSCMLNYCYFYNNICSVKVIDL